MELDELLTAIDSQVRKAAVRAHEAVMEELGRVKPRKIVDVEIPANALIPRELLHADRVAMKFDVHMTDDGVSLAKGYRLGCSGTRATIEMEWQSKPAPEATALVRTKAESSVAMKDLKPPEDKPHE